MMAFPSMVIGPFTWPWILTLADGIWRQMWQFYVSPPICSRFLKLDHSPSQNGEYTVMVAGAFSLSVLIVKLLHFVFVENDVVTPLAVKASLRTHHTFRPETC